MLLRNSITSTKKFFQKTLDNVKSFLSKGSGSTYERLPKTPPCRPFACGCGTNDHMDGDAGYNNNNNSSSSELDHFYNEFTHQWDNNSSKSSKVLKNKAAQKIKASIRSSSTKKCQQFYSLDHHSSSQQENCHFTTAGRDDDSKIKKTPEKKGAAEIEEFLKNKRLNLSPGNMKYTDLCSRSVREKRLSLVTEKLKELEKMDKGNTDHKRDVEEFLQCYSRLTCPAYLDIVDKFLKEMSTEFLGPQSSPRKAANYSKPVWKAVKV